jgi:tetratricopeptide (TPR) repeat protein
LRKSSTRYFYLKLAWLVLTVSCIFSIPLQNTSVLTLFLFLIAVSFSESEEEAISLSFQRSGRILIPVVSFLLFVFGCYFPFRAHQEFELAVASKNVAEADQHLSKAVRYNPYQPYYRFVFIRKIVNANPKLDAVRWLNLVSLLNEATALNPLEYEFYLYKARIFRKLLQNKSTLRYYSLAVASYQTALDYNPYNVFLRLEFASFLHQIRRDSLAEVEVRKALEAEPVFLNAHLVLADVLIASGQLSEARKQYARFLEYHTRYGRSPEKAPTQYIRSLLEVNHKVKERVENLLQTHNSESSDRIDADVSKTHS